jgi:hypothetical protein
LKKQESKLIEKIIKILPEGIYVEKTFNPLRRGTPDLYIEAPHGIMWVECKWIPKPWTEPVTEICDSASWPLQKRWLQRAKRNGVAVGVLVGVGNNDHYYWFDSDDFDYDPARDVLAPLAELENLK